ncbi:MAG: HEAT repeat domain-containing protein [Acidimicrobiales bacterium]|nr:HEAT repeat domain-containing protein [Acidimicrobiales bacterium]
MNRRKAILSRHSGDYKLAISLLDDGDAKVRGAALSSLEKLGKLSRKILEKSFCDASPEVRKRAIELLVKRPEEIPLNAFDDEDSLVVETACWAAGEKENQTHELINQLCFIADSHTDQLCREAAVAALGSIGSPLGLETVLEALKDKPAIRRRAVIALAAFDDPKVDEALKKSLNDRDWQVRQIAEDLLDVSRVISPVDIGPRPN